MSKHTALLDLTRMRISQENDKDNISALICERKNPGPALEAVKSIKKLMTDGE